MSTIIFNKWSFLHPVIKICYNLHVLNVSDNNGADYRGDVRLFEPELFSIIMQHVWTHVRMFCFVWKRWREIWKEDFLALLSTLMRSSLHCSHGLDLCHAVCLWRWLNKLHSIDRLNKSPSLPPPLFFLCHNQLYRHRVMCNWALTRMVKRLKSNVIYYVMFDSLLAFVWDFMS